MDGDVLRIGHLSTAYHTAVLLMGTGWVEESVGWPVRWMLLPTGPDIVNAMDRGELDLGYIGLTPAMIGIGRGVEIVGIAGGHVEGTLLSGKARYRSLHELGGDLRATLAQFAGKAIGSPKRGNIHDIIIRQYLARHGLEAVVEVRNFSSAELIADAMVDEGVEAASATPSFLSYLGWLGSYFESKAIVPPTHLWPFNPSYGIFVRKAFLRERPEIVLGFLRAHKRAATFMRARPRAAARVVARTMEIVDEDYVFRTYQVSPKYCIAIPPRYVEATLDFVDPLIRLGYLTRPLSQDDVFDFGPIREIHPEAHHYDDVPNWSSE